MSAESKYAGETKGFPRLFLFSCYITQGCKQRFFFVWEAALGHQRQQLLQRLADLRASKPLSLIHISEPTRL